MSTCTEPNGYNNTVLSQIERNFECNGRNSIVCVSK